MNPTIEPQHDELTATGVIRFQAAADLATARFVSHFTRELTTEELTTLIGVVRDAMQEAA